MITYKEKSENEIVVKVFSKIAGSIKKEGSGYKYYPKGTKVGGDLFKSLKAVKQSLEVE